MKAISFKEANKVYAENQDEYHSLPVFKDLSSSEGEVVCCWKLSPWERIKVLLTGKLWHSILTFNHPLQPISLSVDKPIKDDN